MYDTLIFLHVIGVFSLVAGIVMYSAFVLGGPVNNRSLGIAGVLTAIGGTGALVFGVWLAIYVKGYEVWDGWVLAAIVLWAVAGYAGTTLGRGYEAFRAGTAPAPSLALHLTLTGSILLLLIDMIWKPGA